MLFSLSIAKGVRAECRAKLACYAEAMSSFAFYCKDSMKLQ